MDEKSKKKKTPWGQYIAMLFYMLAGAVCGWTMTSYVLDENGGTLLERLIYMIFILIFLYIGMFLQIIIHETGHLIFGLLSGYGFASFRLMGFMWIREGARIRFRRFSVAGTAGQCLMMPPSPADGKMPVVLYNLGGIFMNTITGLAFLGLYFAAGESRYLSAAMLICAIWGFIMAVTNGLPLQMGLVNNDGHNVFSAARNDRARLAVWVQLKIAEQNLRGIRLKYMPAEWFDVPDDKAMENSLVAAIGVFACNRLVDEGRYEEAGRLIDHLLEIESGMVELHRKLLICDKVFCELVTSNRSDAPKDMLTKEQRKFMKAMKKNLSVLRTEYAYALIAENDTEKAGRIKEMFDKAAKSYPYPGDIFTERELMDAAYKKYHSKNDVNNL